MTVSSLDTDTDPHQKGPRRRIGEFRDADAAAVAEMFNGSNDGWPGGFNGGVPMTAESVLLLQQDRQPLATLIAWDGETAAGYCSLFNYPGEAGVAGYVGLLNVAGAFHGRGFGRDLLQEALRRFVALGYRRLDLHTWAGNMKAVPLYKKSGYFWAPDTSVHMENFVPLILGTPAVAGFFAQVDWYTAQVRDLSVKEDLYLDGKMRIYPYEFRAGPRFVRATIDATAKGLTALETEQWRVACVVDDRMLFAGRPCTVRWEIENRSGRPLPLTLIATARDGLQVVKQETASVEGLYTTEAMLTVASDYRPPLFGQRPPYIESLILLDGQPIRLETGVEIKRPVDVYLEPLRVGLQVGLVQTIALRVANNMPEGAMLRLVLVPSPGLAICSSSENDPQQAPLTIEQTIEGESYAGTYVMAVARTSGVHTLEARISVTNGAETSELVPVQLWLPAVESGNTIAFVTAAVTTEREPELRDSEARIESATQRLVISLREANLRFEDALSGAVLGGARLMVGPPFSRSDQSCIIYQPTIEHAGGATALVLRGTLPHLPHVVVEHTICFTPDNLVRVQTAMTNLGPEVQRVQRSMVGWADSQRLPTIVMPTVYGTVATAHVEFPDWSGPILEDPASFAEGWIARQGQGQVFGLFWQEAQRLTFSHWLLISVFTGLPVMAPGEQRVLPPIFIYAGPGDWHTVRARWRRSVQPGATSTAPAPRDVLQLEARAIPRALIAGECNDLTLSSLAHRELAGQVRFDVPPGWIVTPSTIDVQKLRVSQPIETQVSVSSDNQGPRAAALGGYIQTTEFGQSILTGALIQLGSGHGEVTISEKEEAGHALYAIDNGYLRMKVVPGFLGSVVALETVADGINHLYSAFPQAREFGWLNPWYGGLYAAIYHPGQGEFPDAARLYEEAYGIQPVEHAGLNGRIWRGVTVASLLRGQGLRGLELVATYLTVPGSNIVAARMTIKNHTSAPLVVDAALVGYLQPDGSIEQGELLLDTTGDRRMYRSQRTVGIAADGWVAVRSGKTGRTVALVCGDQAIQVVGEDWGHLGAHVGAVSSQRHVEPHGEQSTLSFLIVANSEEEARAYAALRSASTLP